MNPIFAFLLRQYASQIKSAIAHFIAAVVAALIAWLLVKWPGFDSFARTYLGADPATLAVSISASACVAVNALLTALANNLKLTDPAAASVLDAIATAKAVPEAGTQTVNLAHSTVTVTPNLPPATPVSDGPGHTPSKT